VRGFREIAERLAGPDTKGRVRVWLAGGVVEGVLEFVDGPLWVVADRGARTWIDEGAVQAVTLLDAAGVAEALADAPAGEPPPPAALRARLDALAERFDCNVSGEPPTSDDARLALARLLIDVETALQRLIAEHGDGFLDDGLRIVLGDPGVRREDHVLVFGYRAGPKGRLDLEQMIGAIRRVSRTYMERSE
jgi:hypothetical protein